MAFQATNCPCWSQRRTKGSAIRTVGPSHQWFCPNPDWPPTAIAPVDLPKAVESAGQHTMRLGRVRILTRTPSVAFIGSWLGWACLAPVEDELALGEQPRSVDFGEGVEVAERRDHDLAFAVGREQVMGDRVALTGRAVTG